jgi:hypothetical protein
MSEDIGKWFEGKVQDALKELQAQFPAMFYRFPDSHAARNYLQKQPGDHLFLIKGKAILIEEKCSETHESFRGGFSSLWGKPQAAQHRVWHRAGMPSIIMFCNRIDETVEVWDGRKLAILRATGKRIPANMEPMRTGLIKNLKSILLSTAAICEVER